MCGIWSLIKSSSANIVNSYDAFKTFAIRGPDRSQFIEHGKPYNVSIGFHRLSIMDPSTNGDQPFVFEYSVDGVKHTVSAICNGEIYNYKKLIDKYNIKLKSGSDCEVIGHIYVNHGIECLVNSLEGEFAYVIIDMETITGDLQVFASRDPFGIRPLHIYSDNNIINFSSELKGIVPVYNKSVYDKSCLSSFKPGHYMSFTRVNNVFSACEYHKYYSFPDKFNNDNMRVIMQNIHDKLIESVESRLMSEKPVGCLLSGGLDSSLVASIAARIMKAQGRVLRTFSIGMDNSTDEKYAKLVAEHIGSDHTHIKLDVSTWTESLKDIIYAIETYDKTTIRASTGQYLAGKIISETTDIKVLLIGDGSDELCSGYLYFHKAPSAKEAHYENIRLLSDISLYDVKRADEGISRNGLEARVPFLAVDFVNYYLSIHPELRVPQYSDVSKTVLEKWLLRESFRESGLLPLEVLYRKKEAFSDGVSGTEKSWFQIIQDYVNVIYSDDNLDLLYNKYDHCKPDTKEALFYREWYETFFGKESSHIIPYYWLPKWCGNITEPSARVLDVYAKN